MVCKNRLTCHKTGESAVATGAEGADGVCVLIMYCSGAAYLKWKNCTQQEFSSVRFKECLYNTTYFLFRVINEWINYEDETETSSNGVSLKSFEGTLDPKETP